MAIPRELIRKIRKIEIQTGRLVDQRLAGRYQSVFKGRGMAFSEVRPYLPGDDVRLIDWNVSARTHEPHVKLFVEERELTVVLVVDMSASGDFGSVARTKREVAAEIAALVAFSAIKNGDRVGLLVVTDEVEHYVPPKKGRKHVLRVVSEILSFEPRSRRTRLRAGLDFLGKVLRRRAVLFLISDFLDESYAPALRIARQRHDVVPVVLTDPLEESLPSIGLVTLEDLETGELFEFDASGPEGRELGRLAERRRAEREQLFARLALDFVNVAADRPYVDALVAFFRARERRLRR